jgi:hypothetical protein
MKEILILLAGYFAYKYFSASKPIQYSQSSQAGMDLLPISQTSTVADASITSQVTQQVNTTQLPNDILNGLNTATILTQNMTNVQISDGQTMFFLADPTGMDGNSIDINVKASVQNPRALSGLIYKINQNNNIIDQRQMGNDGDWLGSGDNNISGAKYLIKVTCIGQSKSISVWFELQSIQKLPSVPNSLIG